MMPLLIASTNEGKLREIRLVLDGLPLPLCSLNDVPPSPEPDETGTTFPENARIKAHAYAAASGLVTLAEDSGLAIDALGGRPGVHSARYPGATYPDKFANLWAELSIHERPWTCRYVCAVAVVNGGTGRVLFETVATVEGEIWPEARGSHGFGYDPIFYHPPYERTFGEVSDQEKLAVAHRGQAIAVFREWVERGGLKSVS
ncbi:MAG TPA: non-canonical purine NTP pyrophosphatase [Vicinamibacterales bacterium]|nr:non-canonical purine NTP pyrophosphatase [Acidobacteriota bacterium]HQX82196.1 non-canonical purine NTP pyrophosphatase [Vicinamibacterales bacterium]